MIATLRGALVHKEAGRAVIECGGVGYEVHLTAHAAAQLPALGGEVFLHIEESFAMYGGGATLYGFATPGERTMFCALRDHVPATGAKKALEYLDKAAKSLPDFRRAVLEKDARLLCAVFGFTKKTADKLIESLKDHLDAVAVPGAERIARAEESAVAQGAMAQALSALSALGYKGAEARAALAAVAQEKGGHELTAEQVVRLALKKL